MDDEISIYEPEQIKHIVQRWTKYQVRWMLIVLGISSFVAGFCLPPRVMSSIFGPISVVVIVCMLSSHFQSWTARRFAHTLSTEDRTLLECAANYPNIGEPRLAEIKRILGAIDPKMELLRPSEKKDDNTLLRAATQTDDTAQEQLLRPTQSDNAS